MELALEAEAEALKRASLARRLECRGDEEDDSAATQLPLLQGLPSGLLPIG
jgi:hypothetical protein